ncbi:MAG TPA: hypothetical protein DEH78_07880 [Solibacterales bacterium]|nr:hypothetical protein [Bryobacterales bacterium]
MRQPGIDRTHYRLLVRLFRELTERRELFTQFGNDGLALRTASLLYLVMIGLLSIVFALGGPPLRTYMILFQGLGAFMLFTMLLSETGNSLVNPTEAAVLAHLPINGATYTAAKLTHLLGILLYLVPATNGPPALAGLLLRDARWYFPILHLGVAALTGLLLALLCCALYGWLLRLLPPARLKAAAQTAELFTWLGFVFGGNVGKMLRDVDLAPLVYSLPVLLVAALSGLRFLSADYLVRAGAIQRGSPKRAARRSLLGPIAARWFGGQAGRAGFEYTTRLMRRDYEFRRQALGVTVSLGVVLPAFSAIRTDPFTGAFTPIHFVPHAIGFVTLMLAFLLPGGSHFHGSWIFLLAPPGAFPFFARGVWASLWLSLVLPLNLMLSAALVWFWPAAHALLFASLSLAIGTAYSVAALLVIGAVPFTEPPSRERQAALLPVILAAGLVMVLAVAAQHYLLFPSRATVGAAAAALAAAALAAHARALAALEANMRFRLAVSTGVRNAMFVEV